MKKRHLDALQTLGIKKESYCRSHRVESDPWPPIWGISLTGPQGKFYIETTPRTCDGDGKYHLRTKQFSPLSTKSIHSRQQDAIADAIRRWYDV